MGMTMSGDVSDLCFYYFVEDGFIDSDVPRREYGVLFYARFKDDFVVIGESE